MLGECPLSKSGANPDGRHRLLSRRDRSQCTGLRPGRLLSGGWHLAVAEVPSCSQPPAQSRLSIAAARSGSTSPAQITRSVRHDQSRVQLRRLVQQPPSQPLPGPRPVLLIEQEQLAGRDKHAVRDERQLIPVGRADQIIDQPGQSVPQAAPLLVAERGRCGLWVDWHQCRCAGSAGDRVRSVQRPHRWGDDLP